MDLALSAARAILFILPSYFANSVPVVLGGGAPIDRGMRLPDRQRLFGEGKTIRGFLSGVLAAILVGAAEGALLPGTSLDIYSGIPSAYILAGFLLGAGTMVGDLAGSFLKRRWGMERGKPSLAMDQLMFFVFALAFAYPLAPHVLTIETVLFLAALTYFVHVAANVLAHRLGLKSVPW